MDVGVTTRGICRTVADDDDTVTEPFEQGAQVPGVTVEAEDEFEVRVRSAAVGVHGVRTVCAVCSVCTVRGSRLRLQGIDQ